MESDDPTAAGNPHLWRALTEPMLVYEDHPDTWGDDETVVYNAEREHLVNADTEWCDCSSFTYHCAPGELCKHLIRFKLVRGDLEIPEWVSTEAVDDQLRRRLEADR